MSLIEVKNLYKIFGPRPQQALEELKKGMTKDDLLKKYGHTVGINDASFSVDQGETFVVMGLSGSGKSTLIRCINRLIDPTAGEAILDGENINELSLEELRKVRQEKMGMVFQRFALFPHRTIVENVAYGLEVQGVEKEEREEKALKVLETVGLKEWGHVYPEQLSGGMQQRVGLARALAVDPQILLMDEPFSALDPLIRRQMQDELTELQLKMQKTIMFITHDLDEALRLGDRIAIMKDGKFDQIGTAEEILTNPATEYVANFVTDVDRSRILKAENIMMRPNALVKINDGPRLAMRKMKEEGLSSIFVVGEQRHLEGIVTADKVVEALQEGETSLQKIIETNVPMTTPDTVVHDLIPMAVEAKVPIAVVDENKKLLGIIVRVSVLSGLIRKGDENQHDTGNVEAAN